MLLLLSATSRSEWQALQPASHPLYYNAFLEEVGGSYLDRSSPSTDLIRYFSPTRLEEVPQYARGALEAIARSIGSGISLDEVLDQVWESSKPLLPRDRIGLSFIEDAGQRAVSRYLRASYSPIYLAEDFDSGMAHSSLQNMIESGSARIILDLERYLAIKPWSESTMLLVKEGVRSNLTLPLKVQDRRIGFLFFSSRKRAAFEERHAQILLAILDRIAQSIEKAWAIKRLRDTNESYLSLLGFVSHELRNPLSAILTKGEGYLSGVMGKTPEKAEETIRDTMRMAGYLISMVNNYLDLSRLDSGSLRLDPKSEVRFVEEVLQFAIDTMSERAGERGIRFSVNAPEGSPKLTCDPDLLRVVLVNLLDNAVKYGYKDSVVEMSVGVEGRELLFSVKNLGVGFTEKQSRRLFKRFSRLEQRGLAESRGSGLGLYLSWWIAEKHGGRLTARSVPGKWAEFLLRLPHAMVENPPAS
jgi:signal transduction histidine kinase